jgi:hypothetical protein
VKGDKGDKGTGGQRPETPLRESPLCADMPLTRRNKIEMIDSRAKGRCNPKRLVPHVPLRGLAVPRPTQHGLPSCQRAISLLSFCSFILDVSDSAEG